MRGLPSTLYRKPGGFARDLKEMMVVHKLDLCGPFVGIHPIAELERTQNPPTSLQESPMHRGRVVYSTQQPS